MPHATVSFVLRTEELGSGDELTVTPYVDGVPLVELARRVELAPATAAGEPQLAGRYAGLVVGDIALREFYLDDPELWHGDACLLGCVCGDTGCWPLTASIGVSADEVVWRGFRNGHRRWDLGALGPFTFARAQYEAALAAPVRE